MGPANGSMNVYTPTVQELAAARAAFESSELRDPFYRAATELVDLVIRYADKFEVA